MSTLRTQGNQDLSFFTEGLNFQIFFSGFNLIYTHSPVSSEIQIWLFQHQRKKKGDQRLEEEESELPLDPVFWLSPLYPYPYLQGIILRRAIFCLLCLNLCLQVGKREWWLVDVLARKYTLSRMRNLAFKCLPYRSQTHPPAYAPNTFITTPYHHQMLTFSISLSFRHSLHLTFFPQMPIYPSFLPH